MGKLKISKSNSGQFDQASSPTQFTYPTSTSASATVYRGGTGGKQAGTTSLVILANYKDAAGNAYADGQIVKQKGTVQFMCLSAADTDPAEPTLTRCTLVGGASQPTLNAEEMYIKAVDPVGVAFWATRITDRYVWKGTGANAVKYPYVLGTATAVTYADSTSTTSVVLTNSLGGTANDVYAIVTGA